MGQPPIRHARSADGVSIAYTSVGAGPVLIHMPGAPFSNLSAEWRIPVLQQAFERISASLRFVQYDARGTGRSQRDVSDLSLDAMLDDLDAVIAASGIGRFALLGFYHSCPHAIAYAARHPDRVTHLVLFGGSARGWDMMSGPGTQALLSLIERDWDTFVESATHAWLGWPDDAEGRLAADWFRTSTTPAVARATLEAMSDIDVSADLRRVTCPALVLHRRAAPVIPLAMSEELAEALPKGRLRQIDGTSASLFFERTDEVVDEIVSFINGSAQVSDARADGARSSRSPERLGALSPREREVLRLIAQGETNGEIAHRLGISINTVERHVANLYRKIDARGRADATAYAIRSGLA